MICCRKNTNHGKKHQRYYKSDGYNTCCFCFIPRRYNFSMDDIGIRIHTVFHFPSFEFLYSTYFTGMVLYNQELLTLITMYKFYWSVVDFFIFFSIMRAFYLTIFHTGLFFLNIQNYIKNVYILKNIIDRQQYVVIRIFYQSQKLPLVPVVQDRFFFFK